MTLYTLQSNSVFCQRLGNASTHDEIAGAGSFRMQNDSVSVVKTHASILIESLKDLGITIKKTQALEIMSKLENRTDWNRLRARLKNLDEPQAKKPAKRNKLDCMVLLAPANARKTEALKALFELEYKDNETCPVMICMSGDGHTLGNGRDHYIYRHTRITVTYDEFGIVGDAEIKGASVKGNYGLIVNLVSKHKGQRVGAGLALSQFLKSFSTAVAPELEKQVGTLMVDGFEQIDLTERDGVFSQISAFCEQNQESVRRVVMSSREVISSSNASNLNMSVSYIVKNIQLYPELEGKKNCKELASSFHSFYHWKSSSLSDPLIVEDMFWLMVDRDGEYLPKEMDSRISILPGRSSWFMDFRSSLIS
jgi:hypothetical protein